MLTFPSSKSMQTSTGRVYMVKGQRGKSVTSRNGAAMARDAPTVLLLERHQVDDLFTMKPNKSPLSHYENKAFGNSYSH